MIYLAEQQDSDLGLLSHEVWGDATTVEDEWQALKRAQALEQQLGLVSDFLFDDEADRHVVRFEVNQCGS